MIIITQDGEQIEYYDSKIQDIYTMGEYVYLSDLKEGVTYALGKYSSSLRAHEEMTKIYAEFGAELSSHQMPPDIEAEPVKATENYIFLNRDSIISIKYHDSDADWNHPTFGFDCTSF